MKTEMSCEILAGIIGTVLAVLFVFYARNKMQASKKQVRRDASVHEAPDVISKTASGIYKIHKIYSRIFVFVIIAVVAAGAIFDSLTRIIVLSTIGLMLIIVLIARLFNARKRKFRGP
ncbi:MAG TPA: hypothetical protein VGO57_07545 [Verrucomicrobiae bacterium]